MILLASVTLIHLKVLSVQQADHVVTPLELLIAVMSSAVSVVLMLTCKRWPRSAASLSGAAALSVESAAATTKQHTPANNQHNTNTSGLMHNQLNTLLLLKLNTTLTNCMHYAVQMLSLLMVILFVVDVVLSCNCRICVCVCCMLMSCFTDK